MIKKLLDFMLESTKPVRLNHPAYYLMNNNFLRRIPGAPRLLMGLAYHLAGVRRRVARIIVNERIVEIPLITSFITKPQAKILDVGCNESLVALHLASLGHQVTGIDLAPYEFSHPNLTFIQGDFLTNDLPKNHFDYVIMLSTLEHIGVTQYDSRDRAARPAEARSQKPPDAIAIDRAHQCLTAGGELLLSCPFGKKSEAHHQRVYDRTSLDELLKDFKVMTHAYFIGRNQNYWLPAKEPDLANLDSTHGTQGVCIIRAQKK